jgi:lactoylglutathione lyase
MSLIRKIHHVAYRCKDAKETVDWYGKYLDMRFILAIAENEVPSTKEPLSISGSYRRLSSYKS